MVKHKKIIFAHYTGQLAVTKNIYQKKKSTIKLPLNSRTYKKFPGKHAFHYPISSQSSISIPPENIFTGYRNGTLV